MMDGKRPLFIDAITSTFFFPYHLVRFLEIPTEELARHQAAGGGAPGSAAGEPIDYASDGEERLPVVVGGPDDGAGTEGLENLEIELDIDEDFLQRVRDI
jgi:hypothetical protein